MLLKTRVRDRFVLTKDYNYFMKMSSTELINLQNQELNKLPKIQSNETPQTRLTIAQELGSMRHCVLQVELKRFAMKLKISLEWDGECAFDVECIEILEIEAIKGSSEQECNLIDLFKNYYVHENGFIDIIWDDVIQTPQYLEYEETIETLVQKIDTLQDEYPEIDWWDLEIQGLSENGNDGTRTHISHGS